MVLARIAAHACANECQHRAQAFAAAIDQMAGKVRDHGNIRGQPLPDQLVNRIHILSNEGLHGPHGLFTVFALALEWNNNTQ